MLPLRLPGRAALLAVGPCVFLLLPALAAQSVITIPPQQCVWRAGDNAAWAATHLDEAGWQPYTQWKQPEQPNYWIRCHADLSPLRAVDQPGLQVTLYAAYQLLVDGRLIGTAGNVQSGAFTMNAIRDWPLPGEFAPPATIALRITFRIASAIPVGPLPPLQILGGDEALLQDRRDSTAFNQSRHHLVPTVCFSIIGILGFILLGLWLNDRSRYEHLLLSFECLALAPIYLDHSGAAALVDYSAAAYFAAWALPGAISNFARTLFFFALARKRMPLFFWILIGLACVFYSATLAVPFLNASQSLRLDVLRSGPIARGSTLIAVFESSAPFVAFLPWKRLAPRMKPLALLCMTWGASMAAVFGVRLTGTSIPGIPDLQTPWADTVADIEALLTLGVVASLLALLFREQQETARERAELAGEMQAASEIQQMLAPAQIETAPGLRIDIAFRPMREVGGDFYHCRVLPDGKQRVLIGDVSGKGAAAAMAAALILGAASARDSDSPASLLAHLNCVLRENHLSGFATCLCADVAADGNVVFANAGHLAPYCRGAELRIESGLPLGIISGATYGETSFDLERGDRLTLLSDGVVEARNTHGELFGFERAAALSTEPAQSIASAASAHGQDDDITVLTLTFAAAEVLHA